MADTRIDRPEIPKGYGVRSDSELLTWADVEARLVASRHYWLSTTRPNGRPHVVPRWGIWLEGVFWYDGSPATRHARNVRHNESCALHLESGSIVTIVEGSSRPSAPVVDSFGERLSAEFRRKYAELGYSPAPESCSDEVAGGLLVMTPAKAFAWSRFFPRM